MECRYFKICRFKRKGQKKSTVPAESSLNKRSVLQQHQIGLETDIREGVFFCRKHYTTTQIQIESYWCVAVHAADAADGGVQAVKVDGCQALLGKTVAQAATQTARTLTAFSLRVV